MSNIIVTFIKKKKKIAEKKFTKPVLHFFSSNSCNIWQCCLKEIFYKNVFPNKSSIDIFGLLKNYLFKMILFMEEAYF